MVCEVSPACVLELDVVSFSGFWRPSTSNCNVLEPANYVLNSTPQDPKAKLYTLSPMTSNTKLPTPRVVGFLV